MTEYEITAALAEYLEIIHILSQEGKPVRITDISRRMGISKPSVNRAVNTLSLCGCVEHKPYGDVYITQKGTKQVRHLCEKYDVIAMFLSRTLGLEGRVLEKEAKAICHAVGNTTYERIKECAEKSKKETPSKSKLVC